MKNIIFLLLVALSHQVFGQNLEIGIAGGGNFARYKKETFVGIGHAAHARVMLNRTFMQFGAGIESYSLKAKREAWVPNYNTGALEAHEQIVYYASPYIGLNLYFNGKAGKDKWYFYYGATAGYVIGQGGGKSAEPDPVTGGVRIDEYKKSVSGYNVGIQWGYVLAPFKRLGFSSELALRYAGMNTAKGVLFFPATVGIRYKL